MLIKNTTNLRKIVREHRVLHISVSRFNAEPRVVLFFFANVNMIANTFAICYRPSVCRMSSVCL